MLKFGSDRVFAGDYSKYDQRLPAQVIAASLRIYIDIARECNYSEEDLRVMEAMTGDLVYALIAFNGDLIATTEGMHISGNSLTVVVNGTAGSLNLRTFFYSQYPETMKFRDYVALGVYGDDNKGSVHPDASKFNIKDCSEFLGKFGQLYTMPDKESELVPYMKDEDAEFLKRTSVYHPKLGVHVGALLDESCFKMLHRTLKSKVLSEEQASAENIDSALREWFNHGPEVYAMRQEQMREVSRRADITHMCRLLDTTYDELAQEWHEKYTPSS